MRLSPLLMAAVAIAAPLATPLSANAQNPDNLQQSTSVFTLSTEQQPEHDSTQEKSGESLESSAHFPGVATSAASNSPTVVAAFPNPSAGAVTPQVIIPTTPTLTTPSAGVRALKGLQPRTIAAAFPKHSGGIKPTTIQIPKTTASSGVQALQGLEPRSVAVVPNRSTQTTPAKIAQIPQPTPQPTPPPIQQQIPQQTPQPTSQPTPPPIQQQIPQQTPQPTPQQPPSQENPEPPVGTPVFPDNPETTPESTEPRVLVSEVSVRSQAGQLPPELENQVYSVIRTQPGRTTTRTQLQEDINAIFGTGFFSNVQAVPEDTPLGVRVSFVVQANPVLNKVEIQANPGTGVTSVLPQNTADEVFRDQYGRILNLRELQEGIKQLTKRYQDQGYVLANVIGSPQVSETGVVTLQVAEGVVEDVRVRFRNKEGQETNEKGEPIRGRTQDYIITRELQLKPGQVFNRNHARIAVKTRTSI